MTSDEREATQARARELLALVEHPRAGRTFADELEESETFALIQFIAMIRSRADGPALREAAAALVQQRTMQQSERMSTEIGRLISTTERLEASATFLAWIAIAVGGLQLLLSIVDWVTCG